MPRSRDPFLDILRAVATVRVVIWHAIGLPVVSLLFAAMPAMFLVSGSLLYASAERRSLRIVVADRLRRVALPLWTFTAASWLAAGALGLSDSLVKECWRAALWMVPVVDPPAGSWEGGWLSSPLWFLRALLWLLALSPLLVAGVRKAPRAMMLGGVALVVAVDAAGRSPWLAVDAAPSLWWLVGDLALYGTFFVAGMAHCRGLFDATSRRRWLGLAAFTALAAAAWRLNQPVPLGVVNNSHPMHLLVGSAWLCVAFALRHRLAAVARWRPASAALRLLGRRSLTIYLWHTTAIVLALEILDARGSSAPGIRWPAYAAMIIGATLAAVLAFGWVEDIAAGRRPQLWPLDGSANPRPVLRWARPVAAGVALASIAGLAVVPARPGTITSMARPPVPSQQPPPPLFISAEATMTLERGPIPRAEVASVVDEVVDEWSSRHSVPAVVAGMRVAGEEWVAARGLRPDTSAMASATDQLDIMSVTKLFTASMVLRAADAGLIELDSPLPALEMLPEFTHGALITPTMLLTHRSGLVNYRDTPGYQADSSSIDSALSAVRASAAMPLTMTPGDHVEYSSTNFLVLGLLLEQVTGQVFEDLFRAEVLEGFGLVDSSHLVSTPGEPRHAAAGLVTTTADLLRATEMVMDDQDGVSADLHRLRVAPDPDSAAGLGAFGFCPCTIEPDGSRSFFAVGYTGGHTWVGYIESLGITIAIDLYDTIWSDGRYDAVSGLAAALASVAASVVD